MNVDIELLLDWRTVLATLGLLAFLPGFAVRLFVRLYPKEHARRRELVAEVYVRPFQERLFFAVQCLEVSLAEGIPARWRQPREFRSSRYRLKPTSLSDLGLRVIEIDGVEAWTIYWPNLSIAGRQYQANYLSIGDEVMLFHVQRRGLIPRRTRIVSIPLPHHPGIRVIADRSTKQ